MLNSLNQTPINEFIHNGEQLQATFQNNLLALQTHFPKLYARFKDYSPQNNILLGTDDSGHLNLWLNNGWFYRGSSSPRNNCETQAEEFLAQPTRVHFNGGAEDLQATQVDSIHVGYMNYLKCFNHDIAAQLVDTSADYMPYYISLGVGLGYHLPYILSRTNCRMLVIIEPEADIFYASLFTLDYSLLFNTFKQGFHQVSVHVGVERQQLVPYLMQHIAKHHPFLGASLFIFPHYVSDEIQNTAKLLRDSQYMLNGSIGFLEDELFGFNQWFKKQNTDCRLVLMDKSPLNTKLPALIIGSGPSIDQDIALAHQLAGYCIVFSCSSSIDICYKNGITPDFHVETERTQTVAQRFIDFEDKEYLRTINLLALSTLHPEAVGYFKTTCLAMKGNDLSTNTALTIDTIHFKPLAFCNPTSGNGALAFAHTFGFETVVLLGMDLGVIDTNIHHSKDTLYYDKQKNFAGTIKLARHTRQGNFGGRVATTLLLTMAQDTFEQQLQLYTQMKCFNASQGVLIKGAQPVRPADALAQLDQAYEVLTDKGQLSDQLIAELTAPLAEFDIFKQQLKIKNTMLQDIRTIWQGLKKYIAKPQASKEYVYDLFTLIYEEFISTSDIPPNTKKLFAGTLIYLLFTTAASFQQMKDGPEFEANLAECFALWHNYMDDMLKYHTNNPHALMGQQTYVQAEFLRRAKQHPLAKKYALKNQ